MADIFTRQKRSEIMSSVKSKDTKPERLVRSLLHKMGYRFRLHVAGLPGKPDIVLPRHGKVVFVNGCFWHGHKGCCRGKAPKSNTEFWIEKIGKNVERDTRIYRKLRKDGWQILIVWECQTRNMSKLTSRLATFMQTTREC